MDVIAQDERKRVFHTLDGMRGLAALAVVLLHISAMNNWPYHGAHFEPGAYLAVDLFFALSGFVLGFNADRKLQEPGLAPAGRFIVERLIRLYPLYALGTAVAALVFLVHFRQSALILIVAAVMFIPGVAKQTPPGAFTSTLFPLNFPAWSLFYELLVNVAYALSAKRLTKRVLTAILVMSAGLLVVEAAKRGSLDLGASWDKKAGGIIRVTFSFFAGLALYKLWRAGRRLPALPSWLVALLPILVFAVPGPRWLIDPVAVIGLLPVIVMLGVCTEPTGWLRKAMVIGGELSYPIYVLQAALYLLFSSAAPIAFLQAASPKTPLVTTLYVLVLAIVSWIAYAYFDKPARRWLRKALLPRR